MKKLLAIILTILTLMTVMPLSSFAAAKLPKIEAVTFTANAPIFYSRMVDNLEWLEEWEEIYGELPTEDDYLYDICYDVGDYDITVKLNDGSTIVFESGEDYYECDEYTIVVYALVDCREAVTAFEKGEKNVPVTVHAGINDDYNEIESPRFETTVEIEECFIKELKYLSGLPEEIPEDAFDIDLSDVKFEVTYADGSKETLGVTYETDEYGDFIYYLSGRNLYCYFGEEEGTVEFECFDAKCITSANIKYHPFDDIYILDTVYSDIGELEYIEYAIYYKDGSTEEFVCTDFDFEYDEDYEYNYAYINSVDGYDIKIIHYYENYEGVNETFVETEISIEGTQYSDWTYDYISHEEESFFKKLLNKIADFFERFAAFLRNLLA